jgi:hypothetical protein
MTVEEIGEPDSGEASGGGTVADEIFAVTAYEQLQPAPRDFKPWHKPRKQLVREELWGAEVEWLLAQKPPDDTTLRYLGLPGTDLLDLRYFYQRFCADGSHRMVFLGFDDAALPYSADRDSLNVSLQEVRGLENVAKISEILGDDFRLLGDDNSIAWDFAQRLGPFDAINIDLCNQLGHDDPHIDMTWYNAIYKICSLQNRRLRPWSLFLTSRVNKEAVSGDALDRLVAALDHNFSVCAGFTEAFVTRFGALDTTPTAIGGWDDSTFLKAMLAAIAKWLLRIAQDMRCLFSIPKMVGYRVWPAAPCEDMVSIIFRFEPIVSIAPDRSGLANVASAMPDECSQAVNVPRDISHMVDVDAELRASDALWELFKNSSARLLEQARYDPGLYKAWADEHRS